MDIPPDDIESDRKRVIVEFYHEICCSDAPKLRMMILVNIPGNPVNVFERAFKPHFMALFLLTCDKKELNKELVGRVKTWLYSKQTPTENDMRNGMDLFDEYKAELFKVNIL